MPVVIESGQCIKLMWCEQSKRFVSSLQKKTLNVLPLWNVRAGNRCIKVVNEQFRRNLTLSSKFSSL